MHLDSQQLLDIILRVKHDEILRLELFGEEKVALLQLYQMALYSAYYSSPIIFLG